MNTVVPSSGLSQPTLPTPPTSIPWLGLLAVLMGTFISTLNGRLSTFGLADIRGAVGAGFDEGAWITTAQTVAQMFVTLAAVWMGAAYGPRRVLIGASISFAVISLLTPYSPNLPTLLTLQFLGGLASGFFIPLTLSFILLNMPPKYWAFGIAVYALNLELSLNISASLEGWYVEHHSWQWIFWQNVPLALIMSLCLHRGIASKPITTRPPSDIFALVAGGSGLALIYAALDQGNRLDWLNSGVIWGLLLAGGLLLAAFLIHEALTARPLFDLKVVFGAPMPSQFLLIAFLRLTILATAYLIPLFLGSVRGFRALEVGDTLVWIAAPQLILCPLAALMLRRSDARLVASIGFMLHQHRLPHGGLQSDPDLGLVSISSVLLPPVRGAKLRALRRHIFRHSSLKTPGRAHLRRRVADGAPHGRRDRLGVRHHVRAGARPGGVELDRAARPGGRSARHRAREGVWRRDHPSHRSGIRRFPRRAGVGQCRARGGNHPGGDRWFRSDQRTDCRGASDRGFSKCGAAGPRLCGAAVSTRADRIRHEAGLQHRSIAAHGCHGSDHGRNPRRVPGGSQLSRALAAIGRRGATGVVEFGGRNTVGGAGCVVAPLQ